MPTAEVIANADPIALSVRGPSGICAQTGYSPAFIYRLIDTGQLPAVRVGRSVRVLRLDLVAVLDAHRDGGDRAGAA